jgi:glycosyltransferase involved in cell wall biosynthesis
VFQVEDPPLVDAVSLDAGAAAALRRSLGIGAGPVVLYSGNLEPYQGVDVLLQAAPQVPEAWFVFMGGDPAAVEALRARAGTGAARAVFAGQRPPSELPSFLALADVLVSPRLSGENTPFKVYTYLASGRPLVATRLTTHTQIMDDSIAVLVEPTAAGLSGGIRTVLANPVEAAERAARGRALIEREYSPRRYAEKVARAYETVAASVG